MKKANNAKNKAELANKLGISRQLLNHYLKQPDAPLGRDVQEWRDYIETIAKDATIPDDLRRAIGLERLRLIKGQADRVQRENERDTGGERRLSRDVLETLAREIAECHYSACHSLTELAGPLVQAGGDIVAINRILDGAKQAARASICLALEHRRSLGKNVPGWLIDGLRDGYSHGHAPYNKWLEGALPAFTKLMQESSKA